MINYELQVEPEDIPLRGNAMASGSEEYDKEIEDSILARLTHGDAWAWCCVHITAQIPGVNLTGDAYLGACSYESESQFRECPYFEDMKAEALEDLLNQLKAGSLAYAEIKEQLK